MTDLVMSLDIAREAVRQHVTRFISVEHAELEGMVEHAFSSMDLRKMLQDAVARAVQDEVQVQIGELLKQCSAAISENAKESVAVAIRQRTLFDEG